MTKIEVQPEGMARARDALIRHALGMQEDVEVLETQLKGLALAWEGAAADAFQHSAVLYIMDIAEIRERLIYIAHEFEKIRRRYVTNEETVVKICGG